MLPNHGSRVRLVELVQQRIQFHRDAERPSIRVHVSTTQRIPHVPALLHDGDDERAEDRYEEDGDERAYGGNLGLSGGDDEGRVDEPAAVVNGEADDENQRGDVDGVEEDGGVDVSHRADLDFSAQSAHEFDGFPFGPNESDVALQGFVLGRRDTGVHYSPIAGPLLSSMAPRSVKFS